MTDTPEPAYTVMAPRYDVVFKLLFGDPGHSDLIVAFLKTVLDLPDSDYAGVDIVDPAARSGGPGDKQPVLDLRLTTASGKIVNVEIQLDVTKEFTDRVVYALSKTVAGQLKRGEEYRELKRTIFIVITLDPLFPPGGPYHRDFLYRSPADGLVFSHLTEIHTLELAKVPAADDHTPLWEWLRFLSIDSEEELDMTITTASEPVRHAAARLKELSQDEANRMIYEARLQQERDQMAREREAREEGRAEGRAEGRMATVKAALDGGLASEDAVRLFGLSDDEVTALAG
jgi:predicted transposase/invertase (TIGR01784 family)